MRPVLSRWINLGPLDLWSLLQFGLVFVTLSNRLDIFTGQVWVMVWIGHQYTRDALRYTLTFGFYGAKMSGDTKFKWYKPTTALEWPWVMFWMRSFLVDSNSSTLPWQQLSSVWLVCQRGPVPPHQARAKCQGVRLTIGTPNPKIAYQLMFMNDWSSFLVLNCGPSDLDLTHDPISCRLYRQHIPKTLSPVLLGLTASGSITCICAANCT